MSTLVAVIQVMSSVASADVQIQAVERPNPRATSTNQHATNKAAAERAEELQRIGHI